MKVAFVIYEGMTTLDFVGAYDPLTRLKSMGFLPDFGWEICATSEKVADEKGLTFIPTQVRGELSNYDLVYVPGGPVSSLRKLADNTNFIEWLTTAEDCQFKISVCTGALLLGEAGFLKGKKATTHPSAFEELRKYCDTVLDRRIVDEGDVITARGVTSSIDLGLYLCEKFAGSEVKEEIRQRMDYPYGI